MLAQNRKLGRSKKKTRMTDAKVDKFFVRDAEVEKYVIRLIAFFVKGQKLS